jgi:hypothetical protein
MRNVDRERGFYQVFEPFATSTCGDFTSLEFVVKNG